MDILELEAEELERTADWREEKSKEYPEDERNGQSAEHLRSLAQQVRQLQAILTSGDDTLMRRVMEHRSRIGFDTLPMHIGEYFRALVTMYEDYEWTTGSPVGSEVV